MKFKIYAFSAPRSSHNFNFQHYSFPEVCCFSDFVFADTRLKPFPQNIASLLDKHADQLESHGIYTEYLPYLGFANGQAQLQEHHRISLLVHHIFYLALQQIDQDSKFNQQQYPSLIPQDILFLEI